MPLQTDAAFGFSAIFDERRKNLPTPVRLPHYPMSSVWLAVLQKLRVELASITRDTLSLMRATAFRRGQGARRNTVATLDPVLEQWFEASRLQERLAQWHTVAAGVLRRHSSDKGMRLKQLVDEAVVCVTLERQTRANILASQWRREFEEELGTIEIALTRLLDDIPIDVQQRARARKTVVLDLRVTQIDEQRVPSTALDALIRRYETPRAGLLVDLSAPLAEFGQALYREVSSPDLSQSLDQARNSGSDLHLRLYFEGSAGLHRIPWEVLHDGSEFLAIARGISIVRSVESANELAGGEPPRRILITISGPHGLYPLKAATERNRLKAALGGLEMLSLLQIDVAADGSRNTLRRMLDAARNSGRPYDAWHFIGHAQFNPALQRSELAFASDDGGPHWVGSQELLPLLQAHPSLRLVVLNACDSLAFARELAASGVAATVAMQFRISDDAAIAFSEELYASLIEGRDIAGAVNDGRRALFCRPCGVEWMTPVLVMNVGQRSKSEALPHSRDPEGR